jgi:hypothetical protein
VDPCRARERRGSAHDPHEILAADGEDLLLAAQEARREQLNVVFDSLNSCVDMRSRVRFERFFVMTRRHLAFCREQVQRLRAGTVAGAGG